MKNHNRSTKYGTVMALLAICMLAAVSLAQADVQIFTDQTEWETMVSDIEVFPTNADNVFLADQVASMPGNDDNLGPVLTFQSVNSGLSRGFQVQAHQSYPSQADLIFNDNIGAGASDDWLNALSVGDSNVHQNDNWSVSLLDDSTMMAFGVMIRNSRNMTGESITLYLMSEDETIETVELDTQIAEEDQNGNVFIGIISDTPFDKVYFDENSDTDDIGIADFRFGTVNWAAEFRSTLGSNNRRHFRDVDIFRFEGVAGEEVVINLDKDLTGSSTGERATLIVMDHIRRVRFFRIDMSDLPNEITAVLPATGKYRILVIEQRGHKHKHGHMKDKNFRGDYILTMESSEGASDTLEATHWVE